MTSSLTRREFLKLSGLALGGLAFSPFFPPEQEEIFEHFWVGRVATRQISVYSLPRDDARIVRQRFRDQLLRIYRVVTPSTGPSWNPVWYRVWGGWVHSAQVVLVETRQNAVAASIRPEGQLGEITVPYTQTMRFARGEGWKPLYRLYYQTTHWVTGLDEGPDGLPWYQLTDELGGTKYHVPASHVYLIPDAELAPIAPEVPFEEKRIEVDLSKQTLTAFQTGEVVLYTKISSGIYSATTTNDLPTRTPTGRFNIQVKMPSKHMGEGRLTDNLEDYELVGVPWTAFFDLRGYAIHGTFWHNNFGIQMSRGCVNMPTKEAQWLFRWMTPVNGPADVDRKGFGTIVDIF